MDSSAKREKKSLSREKRNEILIAIGKARAPDDRDPREIVEEDYDGDWDKYLRVMAGWHSIPLDDED